MQYDKKEIIRFVTSKVRNNKSPISGFAVVTIELKNGIDIQIPNLLLDGIPSAIRNRFPVVHNN